MDTFPTDLLPTLLAHMPIRDFAKLSLVSETWNERAATVLRDATASGEWCVRLAELQRQLSSSMGRSVVSIAHTARIATDLTWLDTFPYPRRFRFDSRFGITVDEHSLATTAWSDVPNVKHVRTQDPHDSLLRTVHIRPCRS